jgi:ubiquinone/menaquinone biosynthesis C-methylase UbiE
MINKRATALTKARYNRIAGLYDFMEAFPERRFKIWRQRLWAKVPPGKILEIGIGTGKNISYYPPEAQVTGIDLSDRMLARARARATREKMTVELLEMDAQALTFPDNTFDAAVATFVFCSVPEPIAGLRELGRVVKLGGSIVLLEHVRLERPLLGRLMDLLNPLVVRLMGANINRRTVENVRQAGLEVETVEDLTSQGLVKLITARPPMGVEV